MYTYRMRNCANSKRPKFASYSLGKKFSLVIMSLICEILSAVTNIGCADIVSSIVNGHPFEFYLSYF